MAHEDQDPILSPRSALVLLAAAVTAVGAGVLTWTIRRSVAEAGIVAVGVFAAGAKFFDWLIGRR